MKKLMIALSMFGALTLSACAHGGSHHSCCGDECKMDSAKKSCCGSSECKMDKKADATAAPAEKK